MKIPHYIRGYWWNPGLHTVSMFITRLSCRRNLQFNCFNVNCQTIVRKQARLNDLIGEQGTKNFYCFCETWWTKAMPYSMGDENSPYTLLLWWRLRSRGTKWVVSQSKRLRSELLQKISFQSLGIECNLSGSSISKNRINVSYSPDEKQFHKFLKRLFSSIGFPDTEKKLLTLMGDYNIECLNPNEK